MWYISYSSWGTEALFNTESKYYAGIFDVELSQQAFGYVLDRWNMDVLIIFAIGTVYRVVTYILMVVTHRDKQK